MKITVYITSDDTDVPIVPRSIAHTAVFGLDTHSHRVVQLARDTAEAVAVAYLKHGEDLRADPVRFAQPSAVMPRGRLKPQVAPPKACAHPGCESTDLHDEFCKHHCECGSDR